MNDEGSERPQRANPYVGLVPFSQQDVEWFFGREREQKIIGSNLRASRLTLLYGASGVGKSSVLLAGVVPDLRTIVAQDRALLADRDPKRRRPVRFAVSVFGAWRESPLLGLMRAVADSVEEATGKAVAPWVPGTSLRETFAGWLGPVSTLLIILDQFEEYFLYHPGEDGPGTVAGEFVEVVNDLGLRVNFLVSLRADGLAKLDRFKGRIPDLFENYLRVGHLDFAAATRAIEGPKDEYNARLQPGAAPAEIDPKLVDDVLAKIGTDTDGAAHVETPLLQLVMQRLWEAGERAGQGAPRLVPATLDGLGGTENIVQRHLDDALDGLADPQRELAAAVLGELVSPSKTKFAYPAQDLARRTGRELGDIEALLHELSTGERRILRSVAPPPDGEQRPESYEIFHDVLAEPLLAWCDAYEADRQMQELKLRVLEEEHGRRLARRKRAAQIAACLFVLGLVAVILVVKRNADMDSSRGIASSALSQLALDPERSLLLAIEAIDKHTTPESEEALRQALTASRVRAVVRKGRGDDLDAKACDACRAMLAKPPSKPRGFSTSHLAIAADGRTVAGNVDDRLWIWAPATGKALMSRVDLGDDIGVAFTPDGARLLAVGSKASALLALDGSRFRALGGPAVAGATSADGRHVVTVGESGAEVWDLRRATKVRSPATDDYGYQSAAFGDRDTVLLQEGFGGALLRWRWRSSPRTLDTLDAGQGDEQYAPAPFDAAFSASPLLGVIPAPGGRATVVARRGVRGTPLRIGSKSDPVTQAAISPNAEDVVTVRRTRATLSTRSAPGSVTDLVHGDAVDGVVFSPDGGLIATASVDGAARIWETATGALTAELRGHTTGVQSVAFGPRARFVATIGEDLTLRLWDVGDERRIRTQTSVVATPVSGDGTVAVLEESARLQLWDPRAPSPRRLPRVGRSATAAALQRNGASVVVGAQDPSSRPSRTTIVDAATGQRTATAPQAVASVAVTADGAMVAMVVYDEDRAELWRPQSDPNGANRVQLPKIERPTDAAFSPDGGRLVVSNVFGNARIYDTRTRKLLLELGETGGRTGADVFYRVVFSPDGTAVAVAASRDVRIFDSRTGAESTTARLTGHTGSVTSLAYSRDGKRIVTASGDHTTRLWDARDGRSLAVMKHHAARVNSVAFLPDGSIVSGGDDRAVRVYRCESCGSIGGLLRQARSQVTRRLTPTERRDFLGEG